ncbi:MAG: ribonuclease R [Phycisphaeraceae bacterium]|nr:MAG: ribonuclease R [Phycisphaeraceae bacterium]
MALKYRDRLLKHLEHDDYEPKAIDAIAEELRVEDVAEFADAVRALAEEGALVLDDADRVALPTMPDEGTIKGIFRGTAKGFGFVEPVQTIIGGDVFIPPHATLGALSGDIVVASYARDKRRERQQGGFGRSYAGEVVEVVERKRSSFAGEMEKRGDKWLCLPDGRELSEPVMIRDASSKNVKPGDKVVIELLEYPEDGMLAEGVIVKVLGAAGEPDVETAAVIAAFDLPSNDFPEACVQQAREATKRFEDEIEAWERGEPLEGREDRTGDYVTTIDPPDAKDYDDAIALERLPDGGWELCVHIADVAHFIEPGSPLDVEGLARGNSCYLPRLVIPMLPEVLSNGICSLQEGVPRYAKTAIMRYDKRGNLKSRGVCSSLIKSTKRMTYLEAQALIEGDKEEAKKHAKTDPVYTDKLMSTVKDMDTLARAIRERRRAAGMIHLELPDVELVFDEDGRVIDAEPEDSAFTHTIIEMFMVEANECLASVFAELAVPLLRRVHPEPTPGETEDLQRSARVAGYQIPKNPTREELQGLLDATRGTTASRAVHMAVLRTLTKAAYSPALVGHFALASKAYAHFTSPIRRYPDLTVHRALSEYLKQTKNGADRPKSDSAKKELGAKLRKSPMCPPEDKLLEVGRSCSDTEVNAAGAERQLRQFLVLQLLAEQLASGENPEYPGVITGVAPRGVFVQLDKYLADGMIKKEDLPGDVTRSKKPPKWHIDDRTGALVDANSGRSFSMGDRVTVSVAKVDLARRQMDLVLSDPESRAGGKRKGGPMGLTLGEGGGGLDAGKGAGVKVPGGQRRSRKSKQRDKHKSDHRSDRKNKGKRQ